MLSKRLNDFIFIGIIAIVLISIFIARVLILGQMDDRIEDTEQRNIGIEEQIWQLEALVQANRHEQLPSMIEMYRYVPHQFDHGQLYYYISAMMELAGIPEGDPTYREIQIGSTPMTFPQGTPLREISQELNAHRVTVEFDILNVDAIYDFIEMLDESDQFFILHNLYFNMPDGQYYTRVTMTFVTFYEG